MSGPQPSSRAPGRAGSAPSREGDQGDGPDGPDGLADVSELDPAGDLADDLGGFIREQRRLDRLSLRKLSELSGISNPYLSQIERGLRRPSADILKQIARALSISVESLYLRAGILDPRPERSTVVDEIERDPDLDEDQKRALIQVYQSFRTARPEAHDEGPAAADPDERTA